MAHSVRAHLAAGVAVVVTSAVVVAPSLAPPPAPRPATSHAVELSAVVRQLPSIAVPYILPTLSDEVKRGPIPSLGAPLPTLNLPAPAPTATNVNQAIKNVYNAAEPWVRYGFEVATYAVGWIPYVGWLSPQIMIFYNFGERIVRSITFNLDDWVFGPLPFGEGLANVARDSWNATVQLGRDQVNFWLPPATAAAPPVDCAGADRTDGGWAPHRATTGSGIGRTPEAP